MGYPCVRLLACGAGSSNICFRSGDLGVCLQGGGGSIVCGGQKVRYAEAVRGPCRAPFSQTSSRSGMNSGMKAV